MERLSALLRRLVVLQPGEAPALLASFATLLCMFASYTILRPVRDALGITSGLEKIPYLFWGVFIVMLVLQPLYGWLTSRFPRAVFLPWVYGFFIANLLGFYVWFRLGADRTWIARTYLVAVRVEDPPQADAALGGSLWAAFGQVVRSPYLLGIALFVLLMTWVSTFLYLEQQAFVAKAFATADERTRFFGGIDFWVQAASLL